MFQSERKAKVKKDQMTPTQEQAWARLPITYHIKPIFKLWTFSDVQNQVLENKHPNKLRRILLNIHSSNNSKNYLLKIYL